MKKTLSLFAYVVLFISVIYADAAEMLNDLQKIEFIQNTVKDAFQGEKTLKTQDEICLFVAL